MKKLVKSQSQKIICGVCGGIAEYFNLDPTLVRVLFVILGFSGSGLLAYIIAAILMPEE